MKLQVIDLLGKVAGDIELDDMVFNVVPRKDFLATVVRWQLAKRQAGTHDCKGRSDVSRSSKKIYRQKGTGNARHGAKTANIFRGGGVVFGPTPRSHAFRLNKKVRKLALCSLLSLKVRENNLVVVNDLQLETAKTADLKNRVKALNITSGLFVDTKENESQHVNFGLACSNLYKIDLIMDGGLNVYDGLRHEKIVLTTGAVENLQKRLILE